MPLEEMPLEEMPLEEMPLEERVLGIVSELVFELRPKHKRRKRITPNSTLDRDLGLDSLAIAELVLRLERAFSVQLAEEVLRTASTPADLALAISVAKPSSVPRRLTPRAVDVESSDGPASTEDDLRPTRATTLTEVLSWHVAEHPERVHSRLLRRDGSEQCTTYAELWERSNRVAAALRNLGVERGERIAIMLPTSEEFFATFMGTLQAGAVPVPIYPPFRLSRLEDHLRRQAKILRNAGAVLLLTTPEATRVGALLRGQVASLRQVENASELMARTVPSENAESVQVPDSSSPQEMALLQYTSGSTGDPKGVVLTHNNLLSNIRAMGEVLDASSSDVFVSWLPLYHDMGLIGAWLGSLYFGATLVVMSPVTFLARPATWLHAIHHYGGTLTASPNFGYELCLSKVSDAEIEGLDLRSMRRMMNGAERVSATTLSNFTKRFEPYGLAPEALAPVYGLAESSVGLAFPPPGRGPLIDRIERSALTRKGLAIPVDETKHGDRSDRDQVDIVACGQPLPGHEFRVVDELGIELGERHEGRLEFRGPSCTSGYFQDPEKTERLVRDGWLDSGDRAYIASGDAYFTGRIKDILIRAGRNLYPQELEELVGDIEGIRKGCVAVVGTEEEKSGTEQVVVVAETRATDPEAHEQLRSEIEQAVTTLLEMSPDVVVLVPPRTIPKTSSGKIRRAACRTLFETNRLVGHERSVPWQLVRLWLAGLATRMRRAGRRTAGLIYYGWFWLVAATVLGWLWVLVAILPGRRLRWLVVHRLAKAALFMLGLRPRVEGSEHLPVSQGIVVANHASYLDGVVLAATLPGSLAFTAKEELAPQFFAGTLLRRLGTVFVARFDTKSGIKSTREAERTARRGERLVFFPEGTLTRYPGILGFHLGAFLIAAHTNQPVIPVTLRGTRSILRGDQWFPRRGRVDVIISTPIEPSDSSWTSAVQLRDEARTVVLGSSGEPDISGESVRASGAAAERASTLAPNS